ncbi:hypothetical protein ACFRLW_10385 [Streptomyces sp. NPDC056728]|uniref:hypothetical protein n=1 Tax=Paenibacillus chitinolyticus TaxID=79263 RepID=UPI00366B4ECD
MTGEHFEPDADEVVVEITVDVGPFTEALQRAHTSIVFATHPDLRAMRRGGDEPTA